MSTMGDAKQTVPRRRLSSAVRREDDQGPGGGHRPVAKAVGTGRADQSAKFPLVAGLSRRERDLPRDVGGREGLCRSTVGRVPPDHGGRRARPQGREGHADHVRRIHDADGRHRLSRGTRGWWTDTSSTARNSGTARWSGIHTVFNVEQTEGLTLPPIGDARGAGVGGQQARRGGGPRE